MDAIALPTLFPAAMQALQYSPIRSLSVDIMQMIFEIGTQDEVDVPGGPTFPVLISHVCREWRALALSTPTLWATLTMSEVELDHQLHYTNVCVLRSQEALLTVKIDLSQVFLVIEDVKSIVRILQSVSGRIRSFTVCAEQAEIVGACMAAMLKGSMPRLEHFHMELPNRLFDTITTFVPTSSVTSPGPRETVNDQLKSLVLRGTAFDYTLYKFPNLVRLTIGCLPTHVRPGLGLVHALAGQSARTLETLTVEACPSSPAWRIEPLLANAGGRIALTRLRELTLGYFDGNEAAALLQLFDFPALKSVKLRNIGGPLFSQIIDWTHNERVADARPILEQLIASHMPAVDTVSFCGVQIKDTSPLLAAGLVRSFPRLTALHLDSCDSSFVDALALCPQDVLSTRTLEVPVVVAPLLRNLTVKNMDIRLPLAPLVKRFDLLRSKGLPTPRLDSVNVYNEFLRIDLPRARLANDLAEFAHRVDTRGVEPLLPSFWPNWNVPGEQHTLLVQPPDDMDVDMDVDVSPMATVFVMG